MPDVRHTTSGYLSISNTTTYAMAAEGSLDQNTATETDIRSKFYANGVFRFLYATVHSNASNNTTTVTLRVNAVNGSSALSIPTTATGQFEDVSGSDAIKSGDYVTYGVVNSGTGAIRIDQISILFSTQSNVVYKRMGSTQFANDQLASSGTYYDSLAGNIESNSIHYDYMEVYVPLKLKNFYTRIATNTINGSTTLTVYRNDSQSTPLTLTIPASTTGEFEDTEHTVNFDFGDRVFIQEVSTGSSGNMKIQQYLIDSIYQNGYYYFYQAKPAGNSVAGTDFYTPFGGTGVIDYFLDETTAQTTMRVAMTLSKAGYRVKTVTDASTVVTRINGADGNISISIPPASSGLFEDLVNSDTIDADDKVCWKTSKGGAGTFDQVSLRILAKVDANALSFISNHLRPRAFAPGLAR